MHMVTTNFFDSRYFVLSILPVAIPQIGSGKIEVAYIWKDRM